MSPAPDSTLADPQQVIADLQRRLEESIAERDALRRQLADSVEQQTATAEVLGVINSLPGDLAPVFDAILEKAMQLCGAAHGTLRLYDGEAFNLAAIRGEREFVKTFPSFGPIKPEPGTDWELLVQGELHVLDCRDTELYRTD